MFIGPCCLFFLRHLILCRHLFVIWYHVGETFFCEVMCLIVLLFYAVCRGLYSVVLFHTLRSGNGD